MLLKTFRNTILGLFIFSILVASCNREATIDRVLFKETKNKVYKDIDEAKLAEAVKNTLDSEDLKNKEFLTDYYAKNGYQASMLMRFMPKGNLSLLVEHLSAASEHGLDEDYFGAQEYRRQYELVHAKDGIQSLDEAYGHIAALELATADALLNYSSTLQFGAINPNKVLARYYMETNQADSNFMTSVLNGGDLETLLGSIQPQSEVYALLQQALKADSGNNDDRSKTIKVNMERARWKHDIDSNEMIYVNIPAFRLDVYKDGKVANSMKTVVGTGRNNSDKLSFSEEKIKDTPHSHETPVLSSMIHSVQVNPVWNIPESIAGKEILKYVQADRFYLSNAGIDVIQDGKVLENPENLDWSSYSAGNLPFRFRQRPGDENALGKIKFLFKNNSSVYLHDTPAQAAFDRDVRASSHGCVRVAEPLDLANALYGSGDKYNTIKSDMESDDQERAKDIELEPQIQVVLDYVTAENKDNTLVIHPDVYGLDRVIYSYL